MTRSNGLKHHSLGCLPARTSSNHPWGAVSITTLTAFASAWLLVGCSAKPETAAAPADSGAMASQTADAIETEPAADSSTGSATSNTTGTVESANTGATAKAPRDPDSDRYVSRSARGPTRSSSVPVLNGPNLKPSRPSSADFSTIEMGDFESEEMAFEAAETADIPAGTSVESNARPMAAPPAPIRSPDSPSPAVQAGTDATAGQEDPLKDLDAAQTVEVFFATDRRPTSEILPSMLRTFLPAVAVGCICWAMFIGLAIVRRWQTYWMLGAGLATCCGVIVLHLCIVRWQEYSRLASNHSTRFSVLRYEPEGDAYPLHLGRADVSIPWNHQPGVIERPSLLRLEFTESPDKHVMIQSVEVREHPSDWFAEVSDQVRFAEEREGFMFIHGYNVKFGDAIRRTAQLATDLKVRGPVLSYSWPSRGQVAAYAADEASVSWSSPKLEKLLTDLVAHTEIRSINIVAHSMGNRALLESIERLHLRSGPESGVRPNRKLLGSVIMAAPDVDAQVFNARYAQALHNVSDRATLYFTNDDLALQLSKRIHVSPRLGLEVLPGDFAIEAVHTGDQGLFALGHSYYGNDPVVIEDMRRVLQHRTPASKRSHLRLAKLENGLEYFELDRARFARRQTEDETRF